MGTTFKGIDVSVWQGFIDFDKVKLSGIDFVIIKGGGSDDDFYTDSCFEINYNNAKKKPFIYISRQQQWECCY